jgi:hypothetical protein
MDEAKEPEQEDPGVQEAVPSSEGRRHGGAAPSAKPRDAKPIPTREPAKEQHVR